MARVAFSALLSAASGKIGDVVMSRWKGIPYVRRRVIPANPQSAKQCMQRHMLKISLTLWQSIKAWAKPPWVLSVSGYAVSGYNQFMDECIAAVIPQFSPTVQGEDPLFGVAAVTPGTPYNKKYAELIDVLPAVPTAETLTISWTARADAAANNMVNPFYRLVESWAWTAATPVLESAATVVITPLTNDEEYEVALVPEDTTAEFFGLSSHQLATPAA
ncbi:hypothetical protein ES705_29933 [subsurface metagenome]